MSTQPVRQESGWDKIPSKLSEQVLRNQGCDVEKIISDLPLMRTLTGQNRYPLRDMEIGQHFFVHNNGRTTEKTQNAVNSSVGHAQRKYGHQFHQRRYPGGIRVWRVR